MTFSEDLKNSVVHDCPCMKDIVGVSNVKFVAVLTVTAVGGYVLGVGVKQIAKDVAKLRNNKEKVCPR